MTSRERINRVFDGLPVDRPPLSSLADEVTRSKMEPYWRDMPIFDLYRMFGYDQIQFGNFGLPEEIHTIPPYTIKCGYTTEREKRGDLTVVRRTMDGKTLESHEKQSHPVKYAVNDEEELELLCRMWESVEVIEKTGAELEESLASYARMDEMLGDMGVFTPIVDPSAVQQMLEYESGVVNFYYLLEDEPELMERTLAAIQRQRQSIYELLAKHVPCRTIIPVENTSTALISPRLYRKYTLPHMQKYAQTMHKYGKKAVIHMCGHLKDLLPELKEIGLDGIHALTPPPKGNCTYEMALDALGDDLIVFTSFPTRDAKTDEERIKIIRDTLTNPRIKNGNFIFFGIGDGIPTTMEQIHFTRENFLKYGTK